ncbi:MAG: alternative ribosome rescue aminoacyl-tRNA hydrolase ArfB [Gemmatimonadales bacterium]
MAFTVPPEEIEFRASRAGGPGGQHVNRSATRVEARWNVRGSPSISDAQRDRILTKLQSRVDSRGVLRVVADERRSQLRNRQAAVERLNALVRGALRRRRPRKKTKPPAAAVERRLEEKRRRAEAKRRRRPVHPDE